MIELTINKRNTKLFRHSIDGGAITIGRNPDNEIYLNSPSVSREHARISFLEGAWFIEDLASKGGTLVNDIKIQHAELSDKDVIQVGQYKIDCSFGAEKKPTNVASIHPVKTEQPQDEMNSETGGETLYPDEATVNGSNGHGLNRPSDSNCEEQPSQLLDNESSLLSNGDQDPNPRQAAEAETEPQVGEAVAQGPSFPEPIKHAPPTHGGNAPPLHGTGVDVVAGPAQGKRIYFTRDSAALGVKDITAVVIKSVEDGYIAQAPNEALTVTLNGDTIDHNPVQLDNGDLIRFSNLSARFFVDPSVE
ncbi:MAG: FHA domain-containing protein [Arenicellales bacterium]|nr:FHA domain-containing protein [Arenicellales bacterium]